MTQPEQEPSLYKLLGQALGSDPFVLFLVLLIIIACIAAVVVWRRYSPKKDSGETLRTGNRDYLRLVTDLAVHKSTWDEDLFHRIEARGKQLHELVNELQALKTAKGIQDQELRDMQTEIRRLQSEHNQMALSVARIEVDSTYTKKTVDEIKEKLERLELPIIAIQSWVERRKLTGGPPTP